MSTNLNIPAETANRGCRSAKKNLSSRMKLLWPIPFLVLAACNGRKDSSAQGRNSTKSPGEERSPKNFEGNKAELRLPQKTGSLQKMEKALEASDHDQALVAFRELLDSQLEVSEAALQARREQRDDKIKSSDTSALDKRIQMLEAWIAEARITLRNHGVDQEAIDEAFLTYKKKSGEIAAARELEDLEQSH